MGVSIMGLKITQLDKQFTTKDGAIIALKNINMQVDSGEFVCVVGATLSGKSTLLRLLAGLETPTAGEVLLDGLPITSPTAACSLIYENYRLCPWIDVAANIACGLQQLSSTERKKRVAEYLRILGLTLLANSLPQELSKAMKQRVLLACALASQPRILLLDEPFKYLDQQMREGMQEFLRQLWRRLGITILMMTGDVEEAVFLSQRLYVLTSSPGTIKQELKIKLPPERLYKIKPLPQFKEYNNEIRRLLRPQPKKTAWVA
ncbi:MAG: ABC transporter ATP-binding protein [Hormoscilla sp.]